MAREQPIELFMPPNILKAKVGGNFAGIDMAAMRRAEAALDILKTNYAEYVGTDVQHLEDSRDRFAAQPDKTQLDGLYRASHDIRGQAATFGYPLVARVATSLCHLIEATKLPSALPLALVDAHVSTIRVIFRDKIKDGANQVAEELSCELEGQVRAAISV
ncbi:MAG: hypothetical protein JWN58_274 [Gammaproteobacteria bacterium]|nr:hypothetical protein [Gammaproteobacteria bacterium]